MGEPGDKQPAAKRLSFPERTALIGGLVGLIIFGTIGAVITLSLWYGPQQYYGQSWQTALANGVSIALGGCVPGCVAGYIVGAVWEFIARRGPSDKPPGAIVEGWKKRPEPEDKQSAAKRLSFPDRTALIGALVGLIICATFDVGVAAVAGCFPGCVAGYIVGVVWERIARRGGPSDEPPQSKE